MQKSGIKVSVVIPVRNEEKYINACIESVLSQDYCSENLEVIIVDGDSSDSTSEIVKSYMRKYEFIRLLKNPKKFVQHALNIGMKSATGEYIVRLDAHSKYANNYITKCIQYLEKTGVTNVGGPMRASYKTDENGKIIGVQNVIAAAYYSKFALGGGKNHEENYEGLTDTVFLGAFRKKDIEKLNYYDDRLIRNEDDDLCFRMIENGMKIYITPEIKSEYYPRNNYKDLFKQYFEYGLWKVAVIKKHKKPARISHLIPIMFVIFLVLFSILSFFSKTILAFFLSVLGIYLLLDVYFSFKNEKIKKISDNLRLVAIHFILHVSYGLGFFVGIFKFRNFK